MGNPNLPQRTSEELRAAFLQFEPEMNQLRYSFQDEIAALTVYNNGNRPNRCAQTQYLMENIHHWFNQTSFADTFHQKPRFKDYQPDWCPTSTWQALLGLDVNNHHHGYLTYEIAKSYTRGLPAEELSQDEELALLITAIVHDWPEASNGDIPYDIKTNDHEKKELQILKTLLETTFQFQHNRPDLQETILSTLRDKTSKLGHHFQTIEQIGYLRTAFRAWRVQSGDLSSQGDLSRQKELREKLRCLTHNVFGNILSPFITKAEHNPFAWGFLHLNHTAIHAITTHLNHTAIHAITTHLHNKDHALNHYPYPEVKDRMLLAYPSAVNHWNQFRAQ